MDAEVWLSEAQLARLKPLLPDKPRGVPRVDDHKVISGIVHMLKYAGRWVDAPAIYGPGKTLYNRWVRGRRQAYGGGCSRSWREPAARPRS